MKKQIYSFFMILCICGTVVFGYHAWKLYSEYQEAKNEYTMIRKEKKKKKERTINFQRLQKINPDIVAWIEVPGTNIDYPVVQGKDNEEYMHHTFRKRYNFAGCIFLDAKCKHDLSSDNNIIYGHHMRNGTMFAQLIKFRDASFVKKHRRINLYLPEKTFHLKVVSAYAGSVTRLPIMFGNRSKEQQFKQRILNRSDIPTRKANGRLYTFVTCSYERSGNRTYVYAVEN